MTKTPWGMAAKVERDKLPAKLEEALTAVPIGSQVRVKPAQGSARTYVGEVRRVFLDPEGQPRADVLMKADLNSGGVDGPDLYSENGLLFSHFSLERKPL